MTAIFRPLAGATAVIASLVAAASAAVAMPMPPMKSEPSSNAVKAGYDRDGYYHHHHYYSRRHVVHAPFARVESGRRTVVDAPFVHVYDGRHGTHVVAPFVDYWR